VTTRSARREVLATLVIIAQRCAAMLERYAG
jgi:hypothetical protein